MTETDPLSRFGRFLMTQLRDRGINHFDGLAEGRWKAPSLLRLQANLQKFTPEQQAVVRRCVLTSLDNGIHDLLFALQENYDREGGIKVVVDGVDVAGLSDGLHGEPYSSEGWHAKYSAHGQQPETA